MLKQCELIVCDVSFEVTSKNKKQKYCSRKCVDTSHRGKSYSEEHKAKISKSLLGNSRALGYKHSDETKRIVSLARLGNKNNLGNKASEETKQKMRIARSKRVGGTKSVLERWNNTIKSKDQEVRRI